MTASGSADSTATSGALDPYTPNKIQFKKERILVRSFWFPRI